MYIFSTALSLFLPVEADLVVELLAEVLEHLFISTNCKASFIHGCSHCSSRSGTTLDRR